MLMQNSDTCIPSVSLHLQTPELHSRTGFSPPGIATSHATFAPSSMTEPLIRIENGVTRHPSFRLPYPVDFTLPQGAHTAIYGPNGSGKSLLTAMITGAQPLQGKGVNYHWPDSAPRPLHEHIRSITFRDVYGGSEPAYYQQRWNRFDEQTFPTVGEVLGRAEGGAAALWKALGLEEHMEKAVNLLSSGELRRLQLARALNGRPEVLVIDNPYIGLDAGARELLTSLLEELGRQLTLVLVVSRLADIPPFVRRVVPVEGGRVGRAVERQALSGEVASPPSQLPTLPPPPLTEAAPLPTESPLICFNDVSIRYGDRLILSHLSWQVERGSRWALTGDNGAGKSTLLSLVCADNPQAYACDIRLFGRRRGRGESIWDIKRHIGYVSPEMFSTYRKDLPAIDIVASGLHDTIGLYRRISDAEREACMAWLDTFDAANLARRNYLQLSSGEQRLILLVRAFVKHPDLLILDEPFHGLDTRRRRLARSVIEAYMARPGKTLIMVTHYADELPDCIDHHLHLCKPDGPTLY